MMDFEAFQALVFDDSAHKMNADGRYITCSCGFKEPYIHNLHGNRIVDLHLKHANKLWHETYALDFLHA